MKTEKTYARFGRAALQAGLQHAIDVLQAEMDSLKAGMAEDLPVEHEITAETEDGWMKDRLLPSGLLTTSGLKKGSKEWHAVNNHNARLRYQLKAKTRERQQRANSARSRYESWSPAQRKRWLKAMQTGKARAAQQRANGVALQ